MPNWVFNHLKVEGNQLDIARVKKQLNTPFSRTYKDFGFQGGESVSIWKEATFDNPIFSFWNIVKPENMDAYINEPSTGVPKNADDPNAWFQGNNWYDWNVRNWGTKWDVAVENDDSYPETQILDEGELFINYKFDTAWSPPVPAIATLSKQHSRVVFTLNYEEETSWGGQIEFRNGIMEQTSKYEYRCECGEEFAEEPELDDDGYCPQCTEEEVNG
jgi:hypothetical protein